MLTLLLFSPIAQAGSPMIEDHVLSIREKEYGKGIVLSNHSAIYKLKKTNPNFDAYLKTLQESLDKKSLLLIETDPYSMEIRELKRK